MLEITKLKPVGVFAELDENDLRQLSSYGRVWPVDKGDDVIREGDEQDCLYVVLKGKLNVYRSAESDTEPIGEIKEGEAMGEMNFLDQDRSSATVRAASDADIWRMNRDEFSRFTERHPEAGMKLFRALAVMVVGRFREALNRISREAPEKKKKGWW